MADREESVRRFRSALADAVGRGRRARAEAHQRAEDFRRRTTLLAQEGRAGDRRPAESAARGAALEHRVRTGLEVEEFAAERKPAPNAPNSPEQIPSDGSDLDFSQARIMR
jgi:hypothetical protein